jgi:hypothetical protein
MRKLDRMALVRDFNLFPMPDRLLNLERKYGDSLSYEDLHGVPQPRKRRTLEDQTSAGGFDETLQPSMTAFSQMTGSQMHTNYRNKALSQ